MKRFKGATSRNFELLFSVVVVVGFATYVKESKPQKVCLVRLKTTKEGIINQGTSIGTEEWRRFEADYKRRNVSRRGRDAALKPQQIKTYTLFQNGG